MVDNNNEARVIFENKLKEMVLRHNGKFSISLNKKNEPNIDVSFDKKADEKRFLKELKELDGTGINFEHGGESIQPGKPGGSLFQKTVDKNDGKYISFNPAKNFRIMKESLQEKPTSVFEKGGESKGKINFYTHKGRKKMPGINAVKLIREGKIFSAEQLSDGKKVTISIESIRKIIPNAEPDEIDMFIMSKYEHFELLPSDENIVQKKTIKNQYKGQTPEQVWKSWSARQRIHFLSDHQLVDKSELKEISESSFNGLPEYIIPALQEHIESGQYKKGGEAKDKKVPKHKKLCPTGTVIQTVIISKDKFSKKQAADWMREYEFGKHLMSDADEKDKTYRFRQIDPSALKSDSFKTIDLKPGIKAVIGCPMPYTRKKMEKGGEVKIGRHDAETGFIHIDTMETAWDALQKGYTVTARNIETGEMEEIHYDLYSIWDAESTPEEFYENLGNYDNFRIEPEPEIPHASMEDGGSIQMLSPADKKIIRLAADANNTDDALQLIYQKLPISKHQPAKMYYNTLFVGGGEAIAHTPSELYTQTTSRIMSKMEFGGTVNDAVGHDGTKYQFVVPENEFRVIFDMATRPHLVTQDNLTLVEAEKIFNELAANPAAFYGIIDFPVRDLKYGKMIAWQNVRSFDQHEGIKDYPVKMLKGGDFYDMYESSNDLLIGKPVMFKSGNDEFQGVLVDIIGEKCYVESNGSEIEMDLTDLHALQEQHQPVMKKGGEVNDSNNEPIITPKTMKTSMESPLRFLETINLMALPEGARNFIQNDMLNDNKINSLGMDSKAVQATVDLIKSKYPEAIVLDEPAAVIEQTPEEINNSIEGLELLLSDAEGDEKQNLIDTIEGLKLLL